MNLIPSFASETDDPAATATPRRSRIIRHSSSTTGPATRTLNMRERGVEKRGAQKMEKASKKPRATRYGSEKPVLADCSNSFDFSLEQSSFLDDSIVGCENALCSSDLISHSPLSRSRSHRCIPPQKETIATVMVDFTKQIHERDERLGKLERRLTATDQKLRDLQAQKKVAEETYANEVARREDLEEQLRALQSGLARSEQRAATLARAFPHNVLTSVCMYMKLVRSKVESGELTTAEKCIADLQQELRATQADCGALFSSKQERERVLSTELDEERARAQRLEQLNIELAAELGERNSKVEAIVQPLATELETLKQKYFWSHAFALKFSMQIAGQRCQLSVNDAWDQARGRPVEEWDGLLAELALKQDL